MDAEWLWVLAGKDYLFPDQWPAAGWFLVWLYAASVVGPFYWRRHRGATVANETALVGGLAALAVILVLSLPATSARLALATQFQVNRVLWMMDFLGTVYAVWLIVDVWAGRRASGDRSRQRVWATALLLVAAISRGGYVTVVEHPERTFTHLGLPSDEWHDAMAWLARTPLDTHILAAPSHAWRYGSSVRVAAGRDVFLEEVKDAAMSMYSRRVAMRVLERVRAAGNVDAWTPERIRALATQYDLDYVVSERPFDLPVAYRNARFTVYRLAVTPQK
jgi:hypothetical protein